MIVHIYNLHVQQYIILEGLHQLHNYMYRICLIRRRFQLVVASLLEQILTFFYISEGVRLAMLSDHFSTDCLSGSF